MAWAEVTKINSDLSEPLNFSHYISDISVFGAESYVMDPHNSSIWDELAKDSIYLYGHTGIHDYVYNRLTEANIDSVWELSGKCGQQMSSFSGIDSLYANGNSKKVAKSMTIDSYNKLIDIFRLGYQRWCEKRVGADSGVGQWFKDIFDLELSVYATASDIINNEDAWTIIMASEPAMVALTCSTTAMNAMATSSAATEKLTQAILYAGQNEAAIHVMANYTDLINLVVNNQTCMERIAASENAVMALLENEAITTAALASEVAMTALAGNTVAVNLICDFVKNIQTSQNAMIKIDADVADIETWITSILNGNDISGKLTDAHTAINTAVDATNAVTQNAKVVDRMAEAIIENEAFCAGVCSNLNMYNRAYENYKTDSTVLSKIIWSHDSSALAWIDIHGITTLFELFKLFKRQPEQQYWYMKGKAYRLTGLRDKLLEMVGGIYNGKLTSSYSTLLLWDLYSWDTNSAVSVPTLLTETGSSIQRYLSATVVGNNANDIEVGTKLTTLATTTTSYTVETLLEQCKNRPYMWVFGGLNSILINANNSQPLAAVQSISSLNKSPVFTFNPIDDSIECVDICDVDNGVLLSSTTEIRIFFGPTIIMNSQYYNKNNFAYICNNQSLD